MACLLETDLAPLERVHRGKVRDVYALDATRLLIVASDRLSAFDVILPDPIPGKGEWLTQLSNFWFARTAAIVPNHLLDTDPVTVLPAGLDPTPYRARSVVVRRLRRLPLEAIVRGYLIGSGWKDYQRCGRVSGIALPSGLALAERLAEPIFTPSTKAEVGAHDENVDFDHVVRSIGGELAEQVRAASLALYRHAHAYAETRDILIADTKFEFGVDATGRLYLIDELLTPDSSRFWAKEHYRVGSSPPSFDKQYVRDYLEGLDWDKSPPAPRLPEAVIEGTRQRYAEAVRRLTAV